MAILAARVDGVSLRSSDATIPVADEGLLRGDGVFEVLRVYAGRVFAMQEHLDRMSRSAAGLRLRFDVDAAHEDVVDLTRTADGADGLIRLVQTRGGRLIALLESPPELPESVRLASITYTPNGLLDGLKTISYAANALATRLAREQGADEALFVLPDGEVLEGPNFAVFFGLGDDGHLVTPPLAARILPSITRRCIMDLIPTQERSICVSELPRANECFIVSTVREVLPVSRIDEVGLSPPGRLTSEAAALFAAHVRAQTELSPPQQRLETRSKGPCAY